MVSDGMLSQDEIDALLKGGGDDLHFDDSPSSNEMINIDDYLTPLEKDALGEIGNISFGSSATALSTLLNQKVEITTPKVSIVKKNQLKDEFPQPYVAVTVEYKEGFQGINLLVIKQSDAAIIADLMLGGDGTNPSEDLGEIHLSAIQEAMNQMMGSAATSMSTVFNKKVDISPPSIDFLDFIQGAGTERIPSDEVLVKVSFNLKIGNLIDSSIMQLLQVDFAIKLVTSLLNPNSSPKEDTVIQNQTNHTQTNTTNRSQSEQEIRSRSTDSQQTVTEIHSQPMKHVGNAPQHIGSGPNSKANIQPVVFSSFDQMTYVPQEANNLSMLLDIPLNVTVELGRTKRSVKEILELSAGSIIELDKLAGEPVDILVNNKLVAKGEVVVIDENFGVRVTDIISQSDRIKNLQ